MRRRVSQQDVSKEKYQLSMKRKAMSGRGVTTIPERMLQYSHYRTGGRDKSLKENEKFTGIRFMSAV